MIDKIMFWVASASIAVNSFNIGFIYMKGVNVSIWVPVFMTAISIYCAHACRVSSDD